MRHRMPGTMSGRDVRLSRVEAEEGDTGLTIAQAWELIQSKRADGRWWAIAPDISATQLRRLKNGLHNRAWYAGYTSEMLTIRATQIDGLCWRWGYREDPDADKAEIEKNRVERLQTHCRTVGRYMKERRCRKEDSAERGAEKGKGN